MSEALSKGALARKFRAWRADPVLFCVEVLGFEPWEKQCELMRTVAANAQTACRSGHKCGKTTALAALALWWIVCFPRSRVVMIAPTAAQIETQVWMEFKRLYHNAARRGFPLGGKLNETAGTNGAGVGLSFADSRDVFGRAAKTKEALAGISAPNLFVIVDEASGVEEPMWEAIFGNAASNARICAISNPTRLSGTYYDAFHSKREAWALVHISSLDTPNFHGGRVEGLAMPEWVERMKVQWGYPSPHFDVRILGNFPSQAENAVVPFDLVEASIAARAEWDAAKHDEPRELLSLGVDVARFGDDSTVFVPCRDLLMLDPVVIHGMDVVNVAGRAHATATGLARLDEVPLIRVDENGIGSGVVDLLRRRDHVRTLGINVSQRADDDEKYVRRRDELWFGIADWLRRGGLLPNAPRLHAELIAPTYA